MNGLEKEKSESPYILNNSYFLSTIDIYFYYPQTVAVYLLIKEGKALLIDSGTAAKISYILSSIEKASIKKEDVEYICPTHAHLDHAGGAGALLEYFPSAKVLLHPKAARALIKPSRLIEAVKSLYKEAYEDLFGEVKPIPPDRIHIVEDGEILSFYGLELEFFYVEGHASHHYAIFERKHQILFSGDAFGISYPYLQGFIFPTTAPVDFDPDKAQDALKKILKRKPKKICIAHYGERKEESIKKDKEKLTRDLKWMKKLIEESLEKNFSSPEEIQEYFYQEQKKRFFSQMKRRGIYLKEENMKRLSYDLKMNALGMYIYRERIRKKKK